MQVSQDLVGKARAGDREALETLAVAVYGDVWRLLRSELAHEADAEDATQETFREMVSSIRSLREPAAFAGWLYRIALDKARHVRRAAVALPPAASMEFEGGPTPMAMMEREERTVRVKRAVEGLDEDLRRTVRLRYEHALSYGEIAAAMRVPEGTVAWRLNAAHERLKRALAGAGVALALAALETELSAAAADPAPDRVMREVKRIARETPLAGPVPVAAGPRARRLAAGVMAALVLTLFVAWRLRVRRGEPGGEEVSGAGGPLSRLAASEDAATLPAAPGNDASGAREEHAPISMQATFKGRVLDRDSRHAVPDAVVRLTPFSHEPIPEKADAVETRTDAAGNFSVPAAAGTWIVTTMAPGYVPFATERWVANRRARGPQADADSVEFTENRIELAGGLECIRDLEIVLGLPIRGRVVNTAGFAVAGARVRYSQQVPVPRGFVGLSGSNFNGPDPVLTDMEGRFSLDAVLSEGDLQFDVDAQGYKPETRTADAGPGMPEIVVELTPRPSLRVWGTVRDREGSPLPGALVLVSDGSALNPLPTTTDDLGRFDFPAVFSDGPIAVWKEGCGMAVFPSDSIAAGGLDVRLRAADAEVRGIVVGEDGRPLAGAHVSVSAIGMTSAGATAWLGFADAPAGLSLGSGESGSFLPGRLKSPIIKTGEDGRFSFNGFALGGGCGVQLDVMREGHHRQELRILESGEIQVEMKRF
ncbi:MAG: sigma-70 family RNA polymerase sigma factor [Planctomycetes bacterium]|nr:sigma-70 family RNA polymerase sigma factor [Planctomycetota bacterium]